MDHIRRATAVVDGIIGKLANVNFVPMPPPLPTTTSAASLKRKSNENLNLEGSKKHRNPITIPAAPSNVSDANQSSLESLSSPVSLMDLADQQQSGGSNSSQFEFDAVKPLKKIFVSRLPLEINEDMLKRHILRRLPNCGDCLSISMLNVRKNADYASIIVSVGRNEEYFRAINDEEFWPPATIVHQHRLNKPNHGFRSQRRPGSRRF